MVVSRELTYYVPNVSNSALVLGRHKGNSIPYYCLLSDSASPCANCHRDTTDVICWTSTRERYDRCCVCTIELPHHVVPLDIACVNDRTHLYARLTLSIADAVLNVTRRHTVGKFCYCCKFTLASMRYGTSSTSESNICACCHDFMYQMIRSWQLLCAVCDTFHAPREIARGVLLLQVQ